MKVAASNGLERIEHIVVLMLENRSFDHMLGYLSLEGGRDEVDGLRRGLGNERRGERYPIHHLAATYLLATVARAGNRPVEAFDGAGLGREAPPFVNGAGHDSDGEEGAVAIGPNRGVRHPKANHVSAGRRG
jgi:hypothetical protein